MSSSRSDETAESRREQPLAESSEAMGERREEASPPATLSGSSSGASIARCLYRPPIATAKAGPSAIRRYFPDLEADRLRPGYTGIRPKISGPGEAAADFRIDGPAQHGVAGLINLLGIESPGLTASLAIGETVARLAGHEDAC